MPTADSDICARIRRAREQARIDPRELRNRLQRMGIDLSKTGLHRLETIEPVNPNLRLIQAIAEITHVSPGWLLFGKGPALPSDEVGAAIRGRVIDTIELMAGALDLTARQQNTFDNWIASVRTTIPRKISRP